ncbi:MAG: nicotinate-nucleotide adenylyltransferase [Geminicoccaceae bacterium]|nr:MAG: nicotinate-nucleotide adenylyltransferase [Geminicoccaceae bacterium]
MAGERRLLRPVARHRLVSPAAPAAVARRLRVGLLGGSFNPAHEGHLHVSREALKQLDLDQLWWLVAPQNPLKSRRETAPLAVRLARAREVASDPRIRVSDMEARLGTRYTVDTLRRLQARFRGHRFVWLMGADNLASLHRWRRWEAIVRAVPIAVFDREPYFYEALAGVAARRFGACRQVGEALRDLAAAPPPAWGIMRLRPHPAASSKIRAAGQWWQAPSEGDG